MAWAMTFLPLPPAAGEPISSIVIDLTNGEYPNNGDGPYTPGFVQPAPGNYGDYTQWVYHDNDTLTLVSDRGPVVPGIISMELSPDGHEIEIRAPLRGFCPSTGQSEYGAGQDTRHIVLARGQRRIGSRGGMGQRHGRSGRRVFLVPCSGAVFGRPCRSRHDTDGTALLSSTMILRRRLQPFGVPAPAYTEFEA